MYRKFHFFFSLILGMEWPPSLDSFMLEDGHLWDTSICGQHVQSTLLGRFGTTGESVQVQGQCA